VKISELARKAGVTTKAVRYYEQLGLLVPSRAGNGYRVFSEDDAEAVREIQSLAAAGIPPAKAGPFIECLKAGHEHSDDCPASLTAYKRSITTIDNTIRELAKRRETLIARFEAASNRGHADMEALMAEITTLPSDLPVPVDDGAADHLPGLRLPSLSLPASDGGSVELATLKGRTIIYLYPLTRQPGTDIPDGWDAIPGARGCTTEACDFRDHFAELRDAGVNKVWGLSSQDAGYQAEVVDRLRLPFQMLSDQSFRLGDALRLPTFAATKHPRLYSRLTLVLADNCIEHVFYPIFPPNTHAQQVLAWVTASPANAR
jgi:peroxiredoxin/DNA-binding transcriptional MerR regulator